MTLRDFLKVVDLYTTTVKVKVKDRHDVFSILYDTIDRKHWREYYSNLVERVAVGNCELIILVEDIKNG